MRHRSEGIATLWLRVSRELRIQDRGCRRENRCGPAALFSVGSPRKRTPCRRYGIVLVAFILLSLPSAFAEKVSQLNPQGYVNDFAHVLNPSTAANLEALCQEVDQKAHAQIAVVTVDSLGGEPVDMFANDLFTKWRVGYKGTDRGVMLLVSIKDRHYKTEVGYGLEPVLTDALTGRFGREAVPLFRAGNYDGAIALMTSLIARAIAQASHVNLTAPLPQYEERAQQPHHGFPLLLVIIVALLILSSLGRFGGGRGGGWILPFFLGGMMGGGFGRGGFGGFGGGGSGGGGFGGFGGGLSGGGGASGGW